MLKLKLCQSSPCLCWRFKSDRLNLRLLIIYLMEVVNMQYVPLILIITSSYDASCIAQRITSNISILKHVN